MTPALKAFRHYQKNKWKYLEQVKQFFGDSQALDAHYQKIASQFGAKGSELETLRILSYERGVERALR